QGVENVTSGYSGGRLDNPTVNQVYAGGTGHAEVVQVTFDPEVISYRDILEVFYVMHNPTTLNRQDNDEGEIYRSVIFYHDDTQKEIAEDMTNNFATTLWNDPIVTELKPLDKFWPASEEMQDYYNKHPYVGYCQMIIDPKIQKLRQKFAARLKPETV
ncbi:MAG: msrA, partial [Candidatus Saccharibacteria bacterium]|nr:msrA [Candidatus Saccharibacteria bacterium]